MGKSNIFTRWKSRIAKFNKVFPWIVGLLALFLLPLLNIKGMIDLNSGKVLERKYFLGMEVSNVEKQCRVTKGFQRFFIISSTSDWKEQYQYSTNILGSYPIPYLCDCGESPPHNSQPYRVELRMLESLLIDGKGSWVGERHISSRALTEPAKKLFVLNALEAARLPKRESESTKKLLVLNKLDSARFPKCDESHLSIRGHFGYHYVWFVVAQWADRRDIGNVPIPKSDIPSVDEVIEVLIERNSD